MPYGEAQYLLIVRDVTQLKQLEQIRKDFVANVSHELRTPLTVLQGYLEVMDDEHLPEKAMWKKAHNVMLDQTKRMDALVQQLLTLSRIEASARLQFDDDVDVPAMLLQLEQEAQSDDLLRYLLDRHVRIRYFAEILPTFNEIFIRRVEGTSPERANGQ